MKPRVFFQQTVLSRSILLGLLGECLSLASLEAAKLEISSFSNGGYLEASTTQLVCDLEPVTGVYQEGTTVMRSGSSGQVYDIDTLVIPSGFEVNDDSYVQIAATATNTDGTDYSVTADATWSSASPEVSTINKGILTPSGVFEDTPVSVQAVYRDLVALGTVTILDVDLDNYITSPYNFAGDGIPDSWQLAYFKEGSGYASPQASPSLDGRVNYFKYALVLNPVRYESGSVIQTSSVTVDNEDYLLIIYTKPANVLSSIAYQASFGDDPTASTNSSSGVLHNEVDNGDDVTVQWRDTVPLSSPRFAVLDVAYTDPTR